MISIRGLRGLFLLPLFLGAGLAVWGFLIEPGLLRVTEVSIETSKWPTDRRPLRIVALGDLHIGAPHTDARKLDQVVTEINRLEPDIVVLLGDYVIHGVLFGSFVEPAVTARGLARLTPKLGTFAVLGNHDWWLDGPGIRALFEDAGIIVLDDETAPVDRPDGRFWIAGVADDMTRDPDPRRVVGQIPQDAPVIAIAHDPAVFPDVPHRVAVTLAAHTHGGQVYLPFYGAPILPGRAPRRHAYGHIHENDKDLYVTSGLGTSIIPVRLNMPPEIALITLSGLGAR
jgi:predicted MPP superfamily phosphohydrolase